jgi:putative transposase
MNTPKCQEEDYINFLIATQKAYSCTEAARVQPDRPNPASHDAILRVLYRLEPTSDPLWQEAHPFVDKLRGCLVIDDTTLDKPYANKMDLVSYHWSGKHHRVVKGINLQSLIWTDGDQLIPIDYSLYDKAKTGLTKNDHFRSMLLKAKERGFCPEYVLFDSWYASLDNLKLIRKLDWLWLTRLTPTRSVDPDGQGNRPLSEVNIEEKGSLVHLKAYGWIKVFKLASKERGIEYWATNNLKMNELNRLSLSEKGWLIEEYHRGIKQFCGVERCQARTEKAQRNHILFSLRAFLRIERFCLQTGLTWFEAKISIVREAVKAYLRYPKYVLSA